MLFPASLDCPALLEGAELVVRAVAGRLPGETDLAVIPGKSWLTPTLVDSPAVAPIEAGHHTLAELTVGPVVARPAVAGVPLDTFPPVLAGAGADPALASRPLEAGGTLTEPRG